MRSYWDDVKNHRLPAALFLVYWLIALGLDVFRWRKPVNGPDDMVPAVIWMHFVLPVMAGAVVSWWRRHRPGRIAGGMLAGALVLVADVTVLLAANFIAYHRGESGGGGERVTELPVLLIALGLLGSLLGFIGAGGSTGLSRVLNLWRRPAPGPASPGEAGGILPRRMLVVGGGLMLCAAAIVALVVIPVAGANASMGRAVTAFAVNALFNLLVGIPLLVPGPRRAAAATKVLVVMGAFVSLLLGSTLLDAASALVARGPGMPAAAAACLAGAASDLGAGAVVLAAALRRPGNNLG